MMILPFLFVLGLAYLGSRIDTNKPSKLPDPPPVIGGVGHAHTGVIRVTHPSTTNNRFRTILKERIAARGPITRWLVDNAMLEAFNSGDMVTVMTLTNTFKRKKVASEKQAPATETPIPPLEREQDGGEESEPESNESSESGELAELGQTSLKSPLDGVSDEDWMDFVARMRTKAPGYKSEKYLGQYEQNRGRLKQLGVAEPQTPEQEYEALAKDVSAHAQDSADLISQWSGDVVTVNGGEHPVCASGILGLLKSAGPEGARSWLKNVEDRTKFPKTTEAFLRTNGC